MPTLPFFQDPKEQQVKPTEHIVICRCGREAYPHGHTLEEAVKYARLLGWDVDDNGAVHGCIHRR